MLVTHPPPPPTNHQTTEHAHLKLLKSSSSHITPQGGGRLNETDIQRLTQLGRVEVEEKTVEGRQPVQGIVRRGRRILIRFLLSWTEEEVGGTAQRVTHVTGPSAPLTGLAGEVGVGI